jgi:hypothetical protein
MAEDKPGTYTREHNGELVVCAKPKPPAERAAHVRALVALGLTDGQIGREVGCR